MEQNETKLVSAKDLMRLYGFSRPTAYQLLNSSNLPAIRIEDRLYMLRDRFDELLRQAAAEGRNLLDV